MAEPGRTTTSTQTADIAAATVGPYQLLECLGAGGMGQVWKARDRLLNRIVALKFLSARSDKPSHLHDLLREARAASALNHPNIVTVFQIGENEGATYLAMEFVEGESLREHLGRARVAIGEALDISRQIVDGLASAHAHGIVHRDLKPENIMLRIDGCVKLVDFGLAKVVSWEEVSSDPSVETHQSGQLVGTFKYMSPEQARGRPVSPASDVFSLGIVMYELLAGEHPFPGDTMVDTLNGIMRDEPAALSARCPAAPPAISSLVTRALRKDPTKRYSSAVEISEELKRALSQAPSARVSTDRWGVARRWWWAAGVVTLVAILAFAGWRWFASGSSGAGAVRSVAVLTFQAQADDPRAATLASGLPEDLGSALAAAGFRVASRSSVLELGESANARQAGESLGVDAVLEGTVRSFGSGLRVHIELVDARTRFQIWSDTLSSSGEDLLGGDSRAATEIASRIRAAVGPQ